MSKDNFPTGQQQLLFLADNGEDDLIDMVESGAETVETAETHYWKFWLYRYAREKLLSKNTTGEKLPPAIPTLRMDAKVNLPLVAESDE